MELLLGLPCALMGAFNATGTGMVGVIFISSSSGVIPALWEMHFPQFAQDLFVPWTNSSGSMINRHSELCGIALNHCILAQTSDCHIWEHILATLSGNVGDVCHL